MTLTGSYSLCVYLLIAEHQEGSDPNSYNIIAALTPILRCSVWP